MPTEAPSSTAVPTQSHQRHHENIPQTPRQWTPLNPDAEPWQPWSPVNNPLATGEGPPLYSGPLDQPKSCLRPYRHLRQFRTLQSHEPRSPKKCTFRKKQELTTDPSHQPTPPTTSRTGTTTSIPTASSGHCHPRAGMRYTSTPNGHASGTPTNQDTNPSTND